MAESHRPLEGVKCVCVIMFQQLPVAFSMMADLGAEVIKIERPGTGERGRKMQLYPGLPLSPYFETNNRGFKCLTLDIQKKKGLGNPLQAGERCRYFRRELPSWCG